MPSFGLHVGELSNQKQILKIPFNQEMTLSLYQIGLTLVPKLYSTYSK